MTAAYPNPSQILPLYFKLNRRARIRFTITQDNTTPNTTGWTWQLFIKQFSGARNNLVNLTLGNGLSYEVYSDIVLVADFTAAQLNLEEGKYYYELVRTDIETTWIEGDAFMQFAKTSTDTIESSNVSVNVDSNGTPVTVEISSSQTININGVTQAQLDTKQDKPTVVNVNTTAEIDAVYYVTASATFTDPTPVQGKGFTVFVRNGTATVGGIGYSTAGTIIKRVYHSGAWANYQIGGGGTWGSITGTLSSQTDLQTALDGKVNDTGDETIAGLKSFTSGFASAEADSTATNRGFTLNTRNVAVAFSVPTFRPTVNNTVLAFDLMPKGSPTENANGFTWSDWCSADILNDNLTATNTARIAIRSTGAEFGSRSFNGASATPVLFTVDGVTGMTLTALGKLMLGTKTGAANYNLDVHQASAASSAMQFTNTNTGTANTDGTNFGIDATGNAFILQRENLAVSIWTNAVQRVTVAAGGGTFFGGSTAATALVHLGAGTATASTAPLKFTSGTNLTTAENGAMEYNGTNLFFTRTGAVRENVVCASAVNTVSPTSPNRTITVNINGTTYYIHAKTTND